VEENNQLLLVLLHEKTFEHTTMVEDVNYEENSALDLAPIPTIDEFVEMFDPCHMFKWHRLDRGGSIETLNHIWIVSRAMTKLLVSNCNTSSD